MSLRDIDTHVEDESGNLKQIVSPEVLAAVWTARGEPLTRPAYFRWTDDWFVPESEAKRRMRK